MVKIDDKKKIIVKKIEKLKKKKIENKKRRTNRQRKKIKRKNMRSVSDQPNRFNQIKNTVFLIF